MNYIALYFLFMYSFIHSLNKYLFHISYGKYIALGTCESLMCRIVITLNELIPLWREYILTTDYAIYYLTAIAFNATKEKYRENESE